jgi:hypothetical protein
MAERGTEKMTEWLDIQLNTLSSEERIRLIEEICDTLSPQELQKIRDQVERQRLRKLAVAKTAVLEEMKGKLSELELSLNGVVPSRRSRKSKPSVSVTVQHVADTDTLPRPYLIYAPAEELQGVPGQLVHTFDSFPVSRLTLQFLYYKTRNQATTAYGLLFRQ